MTEERRARHRIKEAVEYGPYRRFAQRCLASYEFQTQPPSIMWRLKKSRYFTGPRRWSPRFAYQSFRPQVWHFGPNGSKAIVQTLETVQDTMMTLRIALTYKQEAA